MHPGDRRKLLIGDALARQLSGQCFKALADLEQILDVIEKDVDISMLVLAASGGPEGPGPIITTLAKTAGTFPIPVTIVPGSLTDDEIDALS